MASRGVMMDLMKRLVKTYHEAGGEKWKEEDDDDGDTKNLTPFEAQKLILAKKIQATRTVCLHVYIFYIYNIS